MASRKSKLEKARLQKRMLNTHVEGPGAAALKKFAEKNCTVIHHPVIKQKLAMLRNKETTSLSFRLIMEEISQFLAYEATRDLETNAGFVKTPFEKCRVETVSEKVILVPVLRAGQGMLSGMLRILPFAQVGHVGIYRDKFIHNTVEYYFRLPKNSEGTRVMVLDPLLATGDTAVSAVDRLKEYNVGSIQFVCILAAPYGIYRLKKAHPDISIVTLSVERELDHRGYILPGLGDAGDRLYDTVN